MPEQPFVLKGEMTLVNVLVLQSGDIESIAAHLQQKSTEIAQLLAKSPLIVDCQIIDSTQDKFNFELLKSIVVNSGFVPVGLRNLAEELESYAIQSGWGILRPGVQLRSPINSSKSDKNEQVEEIASTPAQQLKRLMLLDKPVRSGQQVYAESGDIVVLQQTSAGSELLAAGSVHVYGSLRGRVLAGIHGDTSARIFCQKLEAELVAIAGRYRLMDEMDTPLKGKAAMIYLEGEKLVIDPMF